MASWWPPANALGRPRLPPPCGKLVGPPVAVSGLVSAPRNHRDQAGCELSAASQDRQGEFCINDSVSKQNQSATLPGFTSPPPACHTPSADTASYWLIRSWPIRLPGVILRWGISRVNLPEEWPTSTPICPFLN